MEDEKMELESGNHGVAPDRRRDTLSFGLNFLRRPAMLGSVLPSSRFLVQRVLRRVDWARAEFFVEYGPGVGTFTEEILRRMRPDARLIALETNPDFVRRLKTSFADSRLEVIHDSAEAIEDILQRQGGRSVDYVLSGIPFSLMPEETRDAILRSTRSVLAPDGAMLVYQFSPRIRTHLERTFPSVGSEFEPRNFLPAMVFHCNCHPT